MNYYNGFAKLPCNINITKFSNMFTLNNGEYHSGNDSQSYMNLGRVHTCSRCILYMTNYRNTWYIHTLAPYHIISYVIHKQIEATIMYITVYIEYMHATCLVIMFVVID